jgi:hypothetical protein
MEEVPHPERHYRNASQFKAGFREACKSCHFENYTKSLDSVHYAMQARGDLHAPSCVGCHGSHAVSPPAQPRSHISQTCATAMGHLRGLRQERPRQGPYQKKRRRPGPAPFTTSPILAAGWLLKTPELCGKCHTDKKLMAKYKLSTNVLSTYLADFHGTTASFGEGRAPGSERVAALCVDCHGIHDITRVKDPDSRVLQANLVKTCRKCHQGAGRASRSLAQHYEPLGARPWSTWRLFYKILIPFIVGGLWCCRSCSPVAGGGEPMSGHHDPGLVVASAGGSGRSTCW